MRIKPYAYYWDSGGNHDSIVANGIWPSGGLHMNGVYMTMCPEKYAHRNLCKGLYGVHLRGLENALVLFPDKKWIVSESIVPPENVIPINQDDDLRAAIRSAIAAYEANNPRASWPIKEKKIRKILTTSSSIVL